MAIMGPYPTPEGKILSGMIWNNMIDSFGTGKEDFDDPTIKCVENSRNEKIRARRENYIAYLAVRDGLKEYMSNYSLIELLAIGSADGQVSKQRVNITEEDEVILSGFLEFNPDELFSIYATPNIHNINGVDLGSDGHLKSISKFFDIIVAWLSFPMVDVKSSGMGQGIYINGNGNIRFGENEDISSREKKDEIFEEYKVKLTEVSDQVKSHFNETGEALPGVFNMYWDIIASGIVDYINTNEIVSKDTGSGTLSFNAPAPTTDVAIYTGMSEGVCVFGTEIIPKIGISLPEIPPVGSLSFNLNILGIGDIPCHMITVVDEFGVEKEICARLSLGPITGTLATIAGKVGTALQTALDGVVGFVSAILERLGYATAVISQIISDMVSALTEVIAKIMQGILTGINTFLSFIAEQIVIPVVKALRSTLWQPLMNVVQLAAYYTVKTLINLITAITTFIGKVIGGIVTLIGKLVDLIAYVVESVGELVSDIVDFFDSLDDDDDDVEECDTFRAMVALLSAVPTLPEIPDTPEEPEIPENESQCANPNYDPNDPNSLRCIPCSDCPECEPCPPTDDDGNDISAQIPAKVPSDPVDDTDPLYNGALATVQSVLVLP